MLFSSVVFIFFFLPFVLFMYYVPFRKSIKLKNILLLIASLGFYAWGEPVFVLIMVLSIVFNWLFGLLVDKYREDKVKSRFVLTLMVCFNLTIIFIFKYLMFTLENINFFFKTNIHVPYIALPIGISFFTFQNMSYVIDVYRKNGEVQKNPLYVGLYISFFPQLIAGPIVRYETIAKEINYRKETLDDFSQGVCRFIMGLGKKVLLANNMALIADKAFALGGDKLSVSFAWLGAIAYAFQIFFDFSGYSDMAIGLGRMFGFHFLENFNYPYISKSISEFWRRWHISLSTWFRDYVYFPLGGSRVKTKRKLIFNLFVVWALTGLWHGANWTFIFWGLLYFVLIAIEKLIDFQNKFKKLNILKYLYTMLFVLLGWVLFRADSIGQAIDYMKAMFGLKGSPAFDDTTLLYFQEYKYFLLLCVLSSVPLSNWLSAKINKESKLYSIGYICSYLLIFVLSISYIIKGTYNPFIYFNF
ncbi:MAG TPA: MBOAT family protein [Defluviitaleaceae bacterium]|mgnify:CR=1 FL=1|nr:MBOAT family protein [Candidatus Epulonipiscium sp.]HQD49637.1 MBOAT family protein [Defluviitaleaceae bacterium]